MKCYACQKNISRSSYSFCPHCGRRQHATTSEMFMFETSDSAQANRMERDIKKILKIINKTATGENNGK